MLPEHMPYARRQALRLLTDTGAVIATDVALNEYGESAAAAPETVDRTFPCLLFRRSASDAERGSSIVPVGSWGLLIPTSDTIGAHERVRITGRDGASKGEWEAVDADTGATDALLTLVLLERV